MDEIPLSWARAVLKFSLSATASSSLPWLSGSQGISTTGGSDLVDPDDPGKDPRFRKLVDAILFSRRFVRTYNLVLLGVLVVFSIWHWSEKLLLAKRRRDARREERVDEGWSSSSSTIEGTATPPDVVKNTDSDETSPLLATGRPKRRGLGFRKPYYILISWLQYQPPPIPVINKTLPPNSVSLLVLSFLALNIFYNLYRMPLSFFYLFAFADRCGIIFIANLPLLYLLAAKSQPIKFLTGYSYESLNIFHRRSGELLCFEAFLHFLGMIIVWYFMLRRLGLTFAHFIFNRVVGLGLGAFVSYEVLYFTSLGSFRQRCYEIFLALHIFFHIAGLALLWFHHYTSRPYVGVALAIFLIDRLVFRCWLKSSWHPATLTVLEDDETILLSSNWDVSKPSSALVPTSVKNGWKPNDHIFITIPSLSNKHALQTHPFTIFSAAPNAALKQTPDSENADQHAWFSLLIRAQNPSGFTRILLDYARSHPTTRIRLDGPYGSSHALDVLSASNNAILVAGGSGIAVAYPLLYALLQPASSLTDPEVGSPPPKNTRKAKLVWITHSASHQSWVPEEKMKELQDWGLELVVPPPTSEAGRPNVKKILMGLVEGERTGVVVSGPDGLVRDVRNTCAGLIARGEDVKVQVEKFGW